RVYRVNSNRNIFHSNALNLVPLPWVWAQTSRASLNTEGAQTVRTLCRYPCLHSVSCPQKSMSMDRDKSPVSRGNWARASPAAHTGFYDRNSCFLLQENEMLYPCCSRLFYSSRISDSPFRKSASAHRRSSSRTPR